MKNKIYKQYTARIFTAFLGLVSEKVLRQSLGIGWLGWLGKSFAGKSAKIFFVFNYSFTQTLIRVLIAS